MTLTNAHICVTTHGRTVAIQRYTSADYAASLRKFGASENAAAAAARGLITVSTKGR